MMPTGSGGEARSQLNFIKRITEICIQNKYLQVALLLLKCSADFHPLRRSDWTVFAEKEVKKGFDKSESNYLFGFDRWVSNMCHSKVVAQ